MSSGPGKGSRGACCRLRRGSLIALIVGAMASAVLGWSGRSIVRDQQRRMLGERATEVNLILSVTSVQVRAQLGSLAVVGQVTGGSPSAFLRAAVPLLTQPLPFVRAPLEGGAALVHAQGANFDVVAGAGSGPSTGQVLSGPRRALAAQALASPGSLVTSVASVDGQQRLLLAMGATGDSGIVTYEEIPTSALAIPRGEEPAYGDLDIAVYGASRPENAALLVTTANTLPIRGAVIRQDVLFGATRWLLIVAARHPLVGGLAALAPWLLLVIGLLATLAVTAVLELLARRRDYAMALVDERTAELADSMRELEATQAQLVAQERLAAIGELAAVVGHELRNPLGVITNALYLIRASSAGQLGQPLQRQLDTADREVGAAALIVSDLLEYARPRAPFVAPVDVAALIDEALSVAPPPGAITVSWVAPSGVPSVAGDRDQLRQVLLNLIKNAYEAMPEGGSVTIVERWVDETGIEVTVADTGPGMDTDTLARVFEPFFTAKARGIGLGLAVVKRIVGEHGGTITVESSPGAGACFAVRLPGAPVLAEVRS